MKIPPFIRISLFIIAAFGAQILSAQITVVPQTGHSGEVKFAGYSPDNNFLYTIGEDGKVICWDLNNSRMFSPLQGLMPGETAEGLFFVGDEDFLVMTNTRSMYYGKKGFLNLYKYEEIPTIFYNATGCQGKEFFLAAVPGYTNKYKLLLYFPTRDKSKRIFYSPDVESLVKGRVKKLFFDQYNAKLLIADEEGGLISMNCYTQEAKLLTRYKNAEIAHMHAGGGKILVSLREKKGSKRPLYGYKFDNDNNKVLKKMKLSKDSRVVFIQYLKLYEKFALGETNTACFCTEMKYLSDLKDYKDALPVYTGERNRPFQVVTANSSGSQMAVFPFNSPYRVFYVASNAMIQELHKPVLNISDFRWDQQSGKAYVFMSDTRTCSVVDLANATQSSYKLSFKRESSHHFLPDGTFIINDNQNKYIYHYRPDGKYDSVPSPFSSFWNFEYNDRCGKLLAYTKEGRIGLFDPYSLKEFYSAEARMGALTGFFGFSSDGSMFWYYNLDLVNDDSIFFFHTSGKPAFATLREKLIPDSLGVVDKTDVFGNGKYLLISTREMDIDNDRYIHRLFIKEIRDGFPTVKTAYVQGTVKRFSPGRNSDEVIAQVEYADKSIHFILINSGTLEIRQIPQSYASIAEKIQWINQDDFWSYSNVNTHVFRGQSGDLEIVSLRTGRQQYQFLAGEKGFVLVSPLGDMLCSKGCSDFVGMQYRAGDALRMAPGRVFEARLNKPHEILRELNTGNAEIIEAFRMAYTKRMARLGDQMPGFETVSEAPVCRVMVPGGTLYSSSRLEFFMALKCWSKAPIRKIGYEHNGTVVMLDTISIAPSATYGEYRFQLAMAPGINRLDFFVIDSMGRRSLPDYKEVFVNPYLAEPTLYFIGIGVSHYRDSTYNLSFASRDIRDLAAWAETYRGYVYIDTFTDVHAVWDSIQKVKTRLAGLNTYDRVIVSFSGHGLISKDLNFYLGMHGVDFDHPENGGLLLDSLLTLFNHTSALQKLLLIDACHSGEIDREGKVVVDADSMVSGSRGTNIIITKKPVKMDAFQFMKNNFEDAGLRSGVIVISAAGGEEYALEMKSLQNGVFTFALLQCLQQAQGDQNRDARISISELKDYLLKTVPEMTRGRQQPTMRSENMVVDWLLN